MHRGKWASGKQAFTSACYFMFNRKNKKIGMSFKNKTVIVTGAGQGIGFEICRQFSKEGANIILNDIDQILADNAVRIITEDTGKNCIALTGDSGDTKFIQRMGTIWNHFQTSNSRSFAA